MRKQDLRKFDINLMTWILGAFCIFSLLFLILWTTQTITIETHDLTFMLWFSYSAFLIIAFVVYFVTKQPTIVRARPALEQQLGTASKYPLDPGQSYLVKSESPSGAREIFTDAIVHGKHGMFVSRTNPTIIRTQYKFANTLLLWLTEVDINNAINPTDIEELSYTLKKFLRNTADAVVLLEGVEYLMNVLSFNKVLNFVQDLHDQVALTNGNILVPLNPALMDAREFRLIEKEFMELNANAHADL